MWAAKRKQFRSWGSHNLMINLLVSDNSHLFDAYWRALEEIKSYGLRIPSDAFAVLIAGYWETKNAEKAVESFGKMKDFDCQPNLFTYNLILHILVNKGMILLALAVYNLMLKLNCHMNCSTYTILIDGLCKSDDMSDALNLFNEMSQRGIVPSKITYTVVLSGLCQAKRIDEAYQLFENMKTTVKPDFITYNALLNGVCKLGKMDEAFDLLKSFKKDGFDLDLNSYSSLIDGLFRAHRFKEAHDTFHKATNSGITPDGILYTIMIRGLCDEGRVDDAFKLIKEMTDKDLVPDTQAYNTLIKGFCDKGLLDEAQSLKLEISGVDNFPDSCTYTILISSMCRYGLVDDAQNIFNEMEKYGCVPSVITFNALIDGLYKSKQPEKSFHLFHRMEIGKNPFLFLRFNQGSDRVVERVTELCESGSPLEAYKLLTQISFLPTITTNNILINGLCKAGLLDAALNLFKKLKVKGNTPDSVTYSTLIHGLESVGREKDAIMLVKEMVENGCKPTPAVYKTLMKWSCRRNKTFAAFNLWLEYLKTVSKRDEEVIKLVENHLQNGEIERPMRLLLDMDIKSRDLDPAPYTIWLIGFCQVHKTTEALKLFAILKEYDITLTPASCVMLITTLLGESNLNMALEVFHYSLQKGFILKPRICSNLLRSLIRSHDMSNHAIELMKKMDSCGYDMDSIKWFKQGIQNVLTK